MAESNKELLELMKMIDELINEQALINKRMTFKQFILSEKEIKQSSINWSDKKLYTSEATTSIVWGNRRWSGNFLNE